nr:MAG TPA: hypothetical protein [Caudoviricetes sp.]
MDSGLRGEGRQAICLRVWRTTIRVRLLPLSPIF